MAARFVKVDRQTPMWWPPETPMWGPPDLRDRVPEGDLVHLVIVAVGYLMGNTHPDLIRGRHDCQV